MALNENRLDIAERILKPYLKEDPFDAAAIRMLAELAASLHVPEGTLARRLTRITMLAAFPRLEAAHLAGHLSSAHVGVVLDVFHGVEDR